jgi:hypothetical protein
MANGYFSPLPTFTLESLVASRQWSAQQKLTKKKTGPMNTAPKTGSSPAVGAKHLKASE